MYPAKTRRNAMTNITNDNQFYAPDRGAWRAWLQANHDGQTGVWLVITHKDSNTPSVKYDAAVEEALCFGWVDSKPNKRDDESYYLYFAQRKRKSNWSRANKERVQLMIAESKMTSAGMALVEWAQAHGTWDALEDVENLVTPPDLQALLDANETARQHYKAFPPSSKRIILEWILNAKRPATRQKRIEETVRLAEQNIRANHYRQPKGK